MQLYKHLLKDCVWTRSLQITALGVIREKTAAHMEHTEAGMNLDCVCIAKIVTKSQFLLIKATLFLSKWDRLPSPIIFLKRLYCIFSCCMRQVLQFFYNYFICSLLHMYVLQFSCLHFLLSAIFKHSLLSCSPAFLFPPSLKSQLPWKSFSPTPLELSEAFYF